VGRLKLTIEAKRRSNNCQMLTVWMGSSARQPQRTHLSLMALNTTPTRAKLGWARAHGQEEAAFLAAELLRQGSTANRS
jgi:hypothetical protein